MSRTQLSDWTEDVNEIRNLSLLIFVSVSADNLIWAWGPGTGWDCSWQGHTESVPMISQLPRWGDGYTMRLEEEEAFWGQFMHACQVASVMSNSLQRYPPGSSVHGTLQARILEWVAMPSSRGSSLPRDWTSISYLLHWQDGFFNSSATWEALLMTAL